MNFTEITKKRFAAFNQPARCVLSNKFRIVLRLVAWPLPLQAYLANLFSTGTKNIAFRVHCTAIVEHFKMNMWPS